MRDELFRSTWTNCTVSAVFFPTILFPSKLLQPSLFEHDVDCALRIFHSISLIEEYKKLAGRRVYAINGGGSSLREDLIYVDNWHGFGKFLSSDR